jgi:hypothetical protein
MPSADARDALGGSKPRRPHPASPDAVSTTAAPVEPGGDDRIVMLCVRVPVSLRRRVKLAAVRTGSSVQELVADALEAECRRHRV